MKKIERTTDGITVQSDYFDAHQTLTCGQVFRFYQQGEGYTLISGDKRCSIATRAGITTITTNHPDYFVRYFDLTTDYKDIHIRLQNYAEMQSALSAGRGIHILRQLLFETIISFIISANNNIPRIQGIIERLCTAFGTRMDGYYAFPTPYQLRDALREDYQRLGAGYRADYLFCTTRTVLDTDILQKLPTLDYVAADKLLKTLKGVGQKVADCISLFALGHTCCYPTDVWIKRAEGEGTPAAARQKGMDRYGAVAGYAQQYKFYHQIATKNKKITQSTK